MCTHRNKGNMLVAPWNWKSLSRVWVFATSRTIYTVHGILQARILEWVAIHFSRGSSQPRDRTRSFTLQVDSLRAEPQGKPKNTGVGSLSFLQRIFPTQELNGGLLHCRRILYQLSYQGSPFCTWAWLNDLIDGCFLINLRKKDVKKKGQAPPKKSNLY